MSGVLRWVGHASAATAPSQRVRAEGSGPCVSVVLRRARQVASVVPLAKLRALEVNAAQWGIKERAVPETGASAAAAAPGAAAYPAGLGQAYPEAVGAAAGAAGPAAVPPAQRYPPGGSPRAADVAA